MASDRIPRIPDDPLPFDPLNTIIPDDVTVVAVLVVVLILIAVIMRLRKKKVPTDREQLLNPEKKESANQLLVVVLILIAVIMRLSKNREQLPNPTLLELEQLHNPTLLENRTYTSGSYRTGPDSHRGTGDSHRGTGDSHRGTGNSHRTAPDSYRTATEQLPIATEQRGHSMEVEELNGLMDGRGICTYTKKELAKATDNFTTEVGQGASGFVYRANLPGNRMGAVKRAMNLDLIGRELFKQELSVLLRLPRHPHLVDLIGLCLQAGVLLFPSFTIFA